MADLDNRPAALHLPGLSGLRKDKAVEKTEKAEGAESPRSPPMSPLSPRSPEEMTAPSPPPPKSAAELASAHKAGSSGGRLFSAVLPGLRVAEIVKESGVLGEANDDETEGSSTTGNQMNFPVIPPRGMSEMFKLPEDPATEEMWYRVLTPREIKGIDGPYSENELKDMYKLGQLKDTTMMWKEGERDWKQLLFLKELRPRLIQMPMVPPRVGTLDDAFAEQEEDEGKFDDDKKSAHTATAYNPIINLPTGTEIENIKALHSIPLGNLCSRCGAFAVGYLAGVGRNEVDMIMLRRMKDYPKDLVSEVIPGFMYVGHSGAAKLNTLLDMNVSLLINCTNNMANPPDRVPYYRGKVVPLKDKPKSQRPANMHAMIELLEKACDWIENERMQPERAVLSDPIPEPPKFKRQTDKYGRPVRTAEEVGMKRRAGMDGSKKPPPKVLMWSRKGLDRPCFIAAAYLIRQYGFDLDRALNVVETARAGTMISAAYRAALEEFAKKHSMGELLCTDCISNARLEALMKKDDATADATAADVAAAAAGADAKESDAAAAGGAVNSITGKRKPPKAEPCHVKFATSLEHLRRAAATSAGEEGVVGSLASLGDPNTFLLKINHGRVLESGWANLLDLQLVSRRLGDVATGKVFTALEQTGCLLHLRVVNVKGNDLTCSGATTVLDCLQGSSELMVINLSCNKMQQEGANRISSFILANSTVTSLDISSNPLGDEGVAALFQCITMPRAEFEAADGDDDNVVRFNRSLTCLDVGATELGHEAAGALINVFRDNMTLTALKLDFNVELNAKDMKHIFNSLRSYNKTLRQLSLANTPVSAKSMGYLSRVFENVDFPLMKLDLSFCMLVSTHIAYLAKSASSARCLTHLVLNSNDLGDLGGEYLSTVIRGKADETSGECWPPLEYVDCSFCSIEEEGCRLILAAMATRSSITSANLSYNKVGDDIETGGDDSVLASLGRCKFSELRLNGCQLQSKGGGAILDLLSDTSQDSLGAVLRTLSLADNGMHDRSAEAVNRLLSSNMLLENLDLGYNLYSEACAENMSAAKRVASTAGKEKKLLALNVSMAGNNCDPYLLDVPGMARSKAAFRFGVKPSTEDPINGGLTHVPESSRQLHKMRLVDMERAQLRLQRFQLPMNQLSL